MKDLPEVAEIGLNLVVVGKPQACYGCGEKGSTRKKCQLNIQHGTANVNDPVQV